MSKLTSRARFALVLATALACVPAARADVIEAVVGDTFDITTTKAACLIGRSGGQKKIECFLATNRGIIPGTYGVTLTEGGLATVNKVDSTGRTNDPIWSRKKASAAVPPPQYVGIVLGDSFILRIKRGFLGCKVFDIPTGDPRFRGPKVQCWRSTLEKPFPLTYGVALSNTFALAFKYDSKGRPQNAFVRFQPKG